MYMKLYAELLGRIGVALNKQRADRNVPIIISIAVSVRLLLQTIALSAVNKSAHKTSAIHKLQPAERNKRSDFNYCCRSSDINRSIDRPGVVSWTAGQWVEGGCFKWRFAGVNRVDSVARQSRTDGRPVGRTERMGGWAGRRAGVRRGATGKVFLLTESRSITRAA